MLVDAAGELLAAKRAGEVVAGLNGAAISLFLRELLPRKRKGEYADVQVDLQKLLANYPGSAAAVMLSARIALRLRCTNQASYDVSVLTSLGFHDGRGNECPPRGPLRRPCRPCPGAYRIR
jgi:hypothetical protein